MKINYIDYQENILAEAVGNEKNRVYVFDNFENLKNARKYYKQSFLKQKSCFITMADLKEKLFPAEKLVLREEKLAILFYELLTDNEKNMLGIEDYFDAIDLSANFFNFYKELHEYKIEKAGNLRGWQQEKYDIIQSVRERYFKRLDELNYIDNTVSLDFKYFSGYFLMDYQEVVFINKIYFTPMEKDLVKRIEETGYEVELYLQLDERDFDESSLRIRSLTLPEKLPVDIELYHTGEDLLQMVNLFYLLRYNSEISSRPFSLFSTGNFCILDADFSNSSYQKLLSPEKIRLDKEIPFTETLIYKFLDNLYNIMGNADFTMGSLNLELKSLLDACYSSEFRDYYNLEKADLKSLQQLAADDYVYLSSGLIDNMGDKLVKFKVIREDIKRIFSLKNLYQFVEFLEKIDLHKLNDSRFDNNISQYFDALLEIYSIEEMNIVSSWNKYFSNKALGLFRLVLNYLRFKQVNLVTNESQNPEIKDLLTAPHLSKNNLIILNASRGVIPSEEGRGFILTEKQRAELGLKTSTEARLEEKYYFFRHLLSSRRSAVFSLKNLEDNITTSSFVDELMLKYGLENREMVIKSDDFPAISRSMFTRRESSLNRYLFSGSTLKDRLLIEKDDFEDDFSLAYYKYGVLKECYYKFYLEHITRLEEAHIEINKEPGPRVLGILVHEIFAAIIEQSRNSNFEISERQIKDIIASKFDSYYLKINNYYKKYYRDIFLPRVEHSIVYFYHGLKRRVEDPVKDIFIEWKPESGKGEPFYQDQDNLTNIYLNGRIDMLIDTDRRKYLIDFKTGSGDIKQLDFYSLLINPDLTGNYEIEKAIYAVLEEKFETGKPDTEIDFADEIRGDIAEFFNGREYKFEYKSICERCIMTDICRVV